MTSRALFFVLSVVFIDEEISHFIGLSENGILFLVLGL